MSYVKLVPVVAVVAIAVMPASAQADRSRCPQQLERSYTKAYWKVVGRFGRRAPGRNIRRYGVLFRRITFDATCGEIKRSRGQLRRILARPAYPTLTITPAPPAQPPAGVASTAQRATGAPLSSIRGCESGGNYATNTGNGFYGAYQFDLQTWRAVGGSGLPSDASAAEQDMRAARLYAERGPAPWPVCGR